MNQKAFNLRPTCGLRLNDRHLRFFIWPAPFLKAILLQDLLNLHPVLPAHFQMSSELQDQTIAILVLLVIIAQNKDQSVQLAYVNQDITVLKDHLHLIPACVRWAAIVLQVSVGIQKLFIT